MQTINAQAQVRNAANLDRVMWVRRPCVHAQVEDNALCVGDESSDCLVHPENRTRDHLELPEGRRGI